jgi:hypothetical protein
VGQIGSGRSGPGRKYWMEVRSRMRLSNSFVRSCRSSSFSIILLFRKTTILSYGPGAPPPSDLEPSRSSVGSSSCVIVITWVSKCGCTCMELLRSRQWMVTLKGSDFLICTSTKDQGASQPTARSENRYLCEERLLYGPMHNGTVENPLGSKLAFDERLVFKEEFDFWNSDLVISQPYRTG